MKQIEKDIYEKIILKIRKETHYSLKLNKKNIKRELEKFIYMMASCYNNTNFYSLDAIIAVGYRVNSKEATDFRIWATKTLTIFKP